MKTLADKSAIYEGQWSVVQDEENVKAGNVVGMRFSAGDELTFSGRVRAFFMRVNVKTESTPENDYYSSFFGGKAKTEKVEDTEEEDEQVNGKTDAVSSTQLSTAIRSKIIMFDGDYREQEIDKFFAINPQSKVGEHITHLNDENLGEILVLNNALTGTQIKNKFLTLAEFSKHVDEIAILFECA